MGCEGMGSKDLLQAWHFSSQQSNYCVLFQIFRGLAKFMGIIKASVISPFIPFIETLISGTSE